MDFRISHALRGLRSWKINSTMRPQGLVPLFIKSLGPSLLLCWCWRNPNIAMPLRRTLERNNCESRKQVGSDPSWGRRHRCHTSTILVTGDIYGSDKQQFYLMVRSRRKKEIVAVCDGGIDSDCLCGRLQSRSSLVHRRPFQALFSHPPYVPFCRPVQLQVLQTPIGYFGWSRSPIELPTFTIPKLPKAVWGHVAYSQNEWIG